MKTAAANSNQINQMHLMQLATLTLVMIVLLALSGCAVISGPEPGNPAFAPTYPEYKQPKPQQTGSIYHDAYSVTLFEDIRARQIGDMLTVMLEEETSAKKDAKTSLSKTNDTDITNPTLFGQTATLNVPSIVPIADPKNANLAFDLAASRTFDGDGSSEQKNKLSGQIVVTVSDVLPNGYLVVQGEKWITLNRGQEFVQLSGIVRPNDISTTNTVSSTKIANSQITYSGTGELAESNQIGWMAKFFNHPVWPW